MEEEENRRGESRDLLDFGTFCGSGAGRWTTSFGDTIEWCMYCMEISHIDDKKLLKVGIEVM